MTLNIIRKNIRLLITLTMLALSFQNNINAQQLTVINSIDDAITIALSNNSDIIEAKLEKLKANERVSEVYSDNLVPSISLNSRYQRAIKKQVLNIFGQSIEIGSDNSITNTVDVSESLPILGTPVFAAIRIADYYSKVQEENITAAEIDVKKKVKNSYYAVLLAKSIVEVNRLTQKNSQDNFDAVSSKYRNGVATEFDYLRAKVRVENSIPVLSKSERDLEISRKVLLNDLGLKNTQDIEVNGELTYDSTEVWASTDYVINKIAENYIEVRQLNIVRDINEELVRVDRANYLPKLNLFAQYVLFSSEDDSQPILNYRYNNTLFLGLGVRWDLNLFRNSYKVKQSEIEVRKNDEQLAQLKQGLKLRSESAIIAIQDAKERIKTRKNTVVLAERSLELANASYRAGVLQQIDVQAAELSLSESRLEYLQAIYDYQIAKAEIEKLLEK